MARLRPLSGYNPRFGERFRAAVDYPVTLRLPTEKHAEQLRMTFYNYRTALRLEAEHNNDPTLARFALLIDSVTATRLGKTLILHNLNGETFL